MLRRIFYWKYLVSRSSNFNWKCVHKWPRSPKDYIKIYFLSTQHQIILWAETNTGHKIHSVPATSDNLSLFQVYGSIFQIRLGSSSCVVVSSEKDLREVLISKGDHFDGRPDWRRFDLMFGGTRRNGGLELRYWLKISIDMNCPQFRQSSQTIQYLFII